MAIRRCLCLLLGLCVFLSPTASARCDSTVKVDVSDAPELLSNLGLGREDGPPLMQRSDTWLIRFSTPATHDAVKEKLSRQLSTSHLLLKCAQNKNELTDNGAFELCKATACAIPGTNSFRIKVTTKEPRVILAVLFFNEFDMLELYLRETRRAKVHKTIIVESNVTHSGIPKPYYFHQCLEQGSACRARFQPYLGRITLVKRSFRIPFSGSNSPNETSDIAWEREKASRDALTNGIARNEPNGSIVIFSDVDEIPRAATIIKLKRYTALNRISFPVHFHVDMFYYTFSHKVQDEIWLHPNAVLVGHLRDGTMASMVRDHAFSYSSRGNGRAARGGGGTVLRNAGWHASFFGGTEQIAKKLRSYAHREFDVPHITSQEHINGSIQSGEDVLKRGVYDFDDSSHCSYNYPKALKHAPFESEMGPKGCTTDNWDDSSPHDYAPYILVAFESAKDYVRNDLGGGLTNQMMGIANALHVGHRMKNGMVILPSAWTRASWNSTSMAALKHERVPFGRLFDAQSIILKAQQLLNVHVVTEDDVLVMFQKRVQTIDINFPHRFMTVGELNDVIEGAIKTAMQDASKDSDLSRRPLAFRVSLGPLSDMVRCTDPQETKFRMMALETLSFTNDVHDAAALIVNTMSTHRGKFTGVHVRANERDGLVFSSLFQNTSPPHVELLRKLNSFPHVPRTVYLAGGATAGSAAHKLLKSNGFLPLSKDDVLEENGSLAQSLQNIPEKMAAVDFLVVLKSDAFFGFSHSTFSCLVYANLQQKANHSSHHFYDRFAPPWQILMNVDPLCNYTKCPANLGTILSADRQGGRWG